MITSPSVYLTLTFICWVMLFSFWFYKARQTKQNTFRQPQTGRTIYMCAIVLCFALPYLPIFSHGWLGYRLIPQNNLWEITGTAICAAGVSFAIWARAYLGTNWSGAVTLKQDHELIQTGPYSIVRHPIYTGFFIAFTGTAIVTGEVHGFLPIVIYFIAVQTKINFEERMMLQQFPQQYPTYQRKVSRMIPFIF